MMILFEYCGEKCYHLLSESIEIYVKEEQMAKDKDKDKDKDKKKKKKDKKKDK